MKHINTLSGQNAGLSYCRTCGMYSNEQKWVPQMSPGGKGDQCMRLTT